jgi:hypothetical protein
MGVTNEWQLPADVAVQNADRWTTHSGRLPPESIDRPWDKAGVRERGYEQLVSDKAAVGREAVAGWRGSEAMPTPFFQFPNGFDEGLPRVSRARFGAHA